MSAKVYTWKPEPFMLGGTGRFITTTLEEYERIDIGAGYYAYVFQNPIHKHWHVALEACGALIQGGKTKKTAIGRVKKDVQTGDRSLMNKQIKQGVRDRDNATEIPPGEFFGLLKGY